MAHDRDGTGRAHSPVIVRFPLCGERWLAVNSPADRIPSHGTDMLGQRYAFDFLRVDVRGQWHRAGRLRTLLLGVPTQECYAWGEPVSAPLAGTVVSAVDGIAERSRVHPVREAVVALWNALTFTPARLPAVLGNHVILRHDDLFAAFAHLATGSVAVGEGQAVRPGEVIGRVGHTGNSTSPHLHFQFMNTADPLTAEVYRALSPPTMCCATALGCVSRAVFPAGTTRSALRAWCRSPTPPMSHHRSNEGWQGSTTRSGTTPSRSRGATIGSARLTPGPRMPWSWPPLQVWGGA